MKNKIIACLIILVGLLFIALGVRILIFGNRLKKIVKNATYIGETISEENNNKDVIATGKFTLVAPSHDEKLNLNLNTPIAYRKSQVLKKELKTSNSTEYDTEWNERDEHIKITGEIKVGELPLSSEFIDIFDTPSYYSKFNEEEMKASKLQLYEDDDTEQKYFLVDTSHDLSKDDVEFINGEIRYYYKYYNIDDHPNVTIIGRQVDGKLYPIEKLGNVVLFDGILDQKQTAKQYNNKIWIFALLVFIGSALLITWGVYRLREEIIFGKE